MPQLSQLVTTTLTVALLGYACGTAAAAVRVEGQVQAGGGPLASSTVTLWAASAGEPKQLAQAKSGNDGRFELRTAETPGKDVVLYVIAKGGIATVKKGSGDNPAIALLTVLGNKPPAKVVINELTTVASTFTAARFITGDSISGNPLGLRIAAGNAPNLVDPVTGKWGKVLVDPLNSYMTTTMANLDTLGSLISAYFTVADDASASSRPPRRPAASRRRTRSKRWLASPAPRGQHRRNSTRSLTRPTRSRRTVPGAARLSCRISPTSQMTSPSRCVSRAAEIMPMAGSCLMRKAIYGAARTGCLARSPASTTALVAA